MSTTIDSLQIEIISSSTHAASSIERLATSLEKLKKNGSFNTVTKNLNNLSGALRNLPNVYSASNSLRTLANSIEKLKGVGSISSISNSLTKLPTALKSLDNINLEKVAPQIRAVADAVAPLSAVKAGGLNTMVNSLRNLDKVADSLSDEAISRFASKVELLSQKLGPLSAKMTTISAGFKSINSNARTAAGGVDKFDDEVNTTTFNMANMITVVQGLVSALQPLIRLLVTTIGDAMEWDGIKYQFGNAFGDQADIYYDKITQITDALAINKQAFMENSAMAASMLVGFGVDKSDAREMGVGYTELAYDIWAAFNNVYKTLDGADGAMAAVRSAIAGEVEPIRRAGFTIVESQLQQTAANHGLAISLETATEAQKSYLRYLELMDQAQKKGVVGTYAREMQTAEGMTRTFTQQLKTLGQAFGSLFLPILVEVMPYLQAFVELLTEGVHWIASLFGIEIQDIGDTWNDFTVGSSVGADNTNDISENLEQSTKNAKALKNAMLGIDELNVISPTASADTGSSGGSGGGAGGGFSGLPIDSIWDAAILDRIKQDVDEVKEKIRGWMPVIATAAAALAGLRIANLISDLGLVGKAGALFAGVIKAFKFIKEYIMAAVAMAPEVGWFAALFPKLSGWFASAGTAIAGAAKAVGAFLGGISLPVWGVIVAVVAAIAAAAYFMYQNWELVVDVVKRFWAENIVPKLEEIKDHFDNMKVSLEPLIVGFEWLVNIFKSIPWGDIASGFGKIVEVIGGVVFAIVGGSLATWFQVLVGIVENTIQMFSGAIQIFAGVYNFIVALFTGGDIEAAWQQIWDGILEFFKGYYGLLIGSVIDYVEGIVDWFTYLWDVLVGHSIVPDTVNAIIEWFTSLPSKVLKIIGDFVKDAIEKFKTLWSGITNDKSNLVKMPVSLIKSGWSTVKDWIGKIPGVSQAITLAKSGWTSVKNWVGTISALAQKIGLAKNNWTTVSKWIGAMPSLSSKIGLVKNGWSTVSKWIGTMPSLSASIKLVKSGWTSVKNWLGGLDYSLNFKLPKIGINWGESSVMGFKISYPKSFYTYAKGGFPSEGEFFLAREAGPEMVGKIGNRSAVANNDQIVEAISEGVYAAVVAAMSGHSGSGAQEVNVYLDGRQITAAVEKRQRERGASLMGHEVYAY